MACDWEWRNQESRQLATDVHNLTELVKDTWLHEFTAKTKEKKNKINFSFSCIKWDAQQRCWVCFACRVQTWITNRLLGYYRGQVLPLSTLHLPILRQNKQITQCWISRPTSKRKTQIIIFFTFWKHLEELAFTEILCLRGRSALQLVTYTAAGRGSLALRFGLASQCCGAVAACLFVVKLQIL